MVVRVSYRHIKGKNCRTWIGSRALYGRRLVCVLSASRSTDSGFRFKIYSALDWKTLSQTVHTKQIPTLRINFQPVWNSQNKTNC